MKLSTPFVVMAVWAFLCTVRIAINTRFLLPHQLEGFGWYTHEIVRRIVAQHPEDQFIFLFDRPYDQRFVYGPNVQALRLFPPARHPFLFYWWFEWSVARALKKLQADVFFSPDSMCSLRTAVPTVMTCHDLVPLLFPEQIERRHRWYLTRYLPRWLRRADTVLTVSEYVKNDIARLCEVPQEKIEAVYNGCRDGFTTLSAGELEAIKQRFSDSKPYFFYAGAIHPRKNIHRLIRAFDLFKHQTGSPALLLLAGRFGWKTGEVRSAWEQAAHRDDVRFLGYVEEVDLGPLTAAALALLYVSISEGFGLPMVEAMNCDTPVICSNTSCLPEIAGKAALQVDPFLEETIAAGMHEIWTNPAKAQELVLEGRKQRLKYDWDVAAARIYEVLQQAAKRSA